MMFSSLSARDSLWRMPLREEYVDIWGDEEVQTCDGSRSPRRCWLEKDRRKRGRMRGMLATMMTMFNSTDIQMV